MKADVPLRMLKKSHDLNTTYDILVSNFDKCILNTHTTKYSLPTL